jgi:predicted Zn-dependent protease
VRFKLLLAFLILVTPRVLAEGLPDLGEAAQADLSPQVERRIGESVMRDIRRDPAYLNDPEVSAYLNQIGGRLASAAQTRQDFEFFAIRDRTLNAFAMPGGFIGVHSGLILGAQAESELAGVLSHEIAHVTQRHIARMVGKQNQAGLITIATMLVAILAARSNSQVSQAAMATGMAVGAQTQLNYSRDFEREADRIGIQTLEEAGFDVRGMASFFERLQRFGRVYENNAPAYLRTHPLTTERISDMDNRAQQRPYRQVPDALDFQLVRAKLRVLQDTPREAVTEFETQLKEGKFQSEAAARYGLARARLAARNLPGAQQELAALRKLKVSSPMVDTLAAELKQAQGDSAAATQIYREARGRYPQNRALVYGYIDSMLAGRNPQEALNVSSAELRTYPEDSRLHEFQARSYSALGKRLAQHRAQAEVYVLEGQLPAAIEQLQLAQRAGDGDFYELSAVDARLRELRVRHAEELKAAKQR